MRTTPTNPASRAVPRTPIPPAPRATPALATLLASALAGCTAPGPATPPRPAPLNHPVFFVLENPADVPQLIRDCDEWIATIPGIVSYYCGTPFDSGRDGVDDAYDVGLYVGFASPEAYASYVEHPNHVRLVEKWRPRLRSLLVRDVIDETP